MELKLEGTLSYIDDYDRLKIYGDSIDKLQKHCKGETKPFDQTEFTVCLPKTIKEVPDDIRGLIGYRVIIYVRLQPYSFVSKIDRNRGARVTGTKLVLVDIKKHQQYE